MADERCPGRLAMRSCSIMNRLLYILSKLENCIYNFVSRLFDMVTAANNSTKTCTLRMKQILTISPVRSFA